MATDLAHDVFVSYAAADRGWVEGVLLDALTRAGVRYHSEEAFEPGRPRLVEFESAVQRSRRTVLASALRPAGVPHPKTMPTRSR